MVSIKPNARKNPVYVFDGDQEAYLAGVKEDREFMVKNEHKPGREKWVVEAWLKAKGIPYVLEDLQQPEMDPPDVSFKGQGIEIVEVMPPGRRRGTEYNEDVALAEKGQFTLRWSDSLSTITNHAHEWLTEQIQKKADKYRKKGLSSQEWLLLVYANFGSIPTIQWDKVREHLALNPPPFKGIEVLRDTRVEFSFETSTLTGNTHGPSNLP